MPVPEFVLSLREKIGHDLLWLPAVTAVVLRDDGRVLLARRSDNGNWGLVSGIVEPGEEPAVTAVRECLEETGVVAVVEDLVAIKAGEPVQYPNGDRCQFLDHTFRCRWVSGEARVNDDESLEVGWYHPSDTPELPPHQRARLDAALAHDGRARFVV
ncbi:NUDIX domain-containing protein [Kocuria sp. SM24M-10]|uniref:NUDIX hydrolase n=1 Tax=Kocuria sp. SM24M-10 TaxID=1660349 RepID=UPI00064B1A55|nr:NUDIX domain-containing protein [Kocuria sp. SM24M-10]KLU09173.1 DNA mismatch repair protein MutT [Kocuria sp. SM24M-10]